MKTHVVNKNKNLGKNEFRLHRSRNAGQIPNREKREIHESDFRIYFSLLYRDSRQEAQKAQNQLLENCPAVPTCFCAFCAFLWQFSAGADFSLSCRAVSRGAGEGGRI
jgi:hypothetical protein